MFPATIFCCRPSCDSHFFFAIVTALFYNNQTTAQNGSANGTINKGSFPEELNGSNFTYPFPVKMFKFSNQFRDLERAFMDVEPFYRPNGKVAVLLHGKNFCGPTWNGTIPALASEGYRVISPDQVGFCKSSKPENCQFNLRQLAWNTRGLIDALGIANVTVIGHSFGGMLATMVGLPYYETIDELVLVNPFGLEDYSEKGVPYIPIEQSRNSEAASTFTSTKAYEQQFYYVDEWDDSYDIWVSMLVNIYYESRRDQFIKNQGQIVDLVLTEPIAQYFRDLKPRTLLMVGDQDNTAIGVQWAPADVAATLGHFDVLGPEVATKLANGELVNFTELGHAPQISDPDLFHEKLLGWLST